MTQSKLIEKTIFLTGASLLSFFSLVVTAEDKKPSRPFILLTNDDGIDAEGLKALREEMEKVGDVLVVAPTKDWSGGSQLVAVKDRVRVKVLTSEAPATARGKAMYAVDGSPATCVLLATEHFAEGRRFDLVVSGINSGENVGLDIPISGTVGAARMAADLGIPALALSVPHGSKEFRAAAEFSTKLVNEVLKKGLDPGLILNVNFPRGPPSEWKPPLLTQPGGRGFTLTYKRQEATGEELVFEPHLELCKDPRPERSDSLALTKGNVIVTPLGAITANTEAWKKLEGWGFFR